MSDMVQREDIEWTNTWIAKANKSCRRCLLIGDSTTRGIRPKLEIMAWELMAIDIFAASYAIEDDWFWKSLKCFLETVDYKYDLIVIHYGFHHGFGTQCYANDKDRQSFYHHYERLIHMVKKYGRNFMIMTGTSEHVKDNLGLIWEEREKEIRTRNDIAKKIAEENNIEVFDLHGLMNTEGKHYAHRDVQHFDLRANSFIAFNMMTFIIGQVNSLQDDANQVKEELRKRFSFSNRKIMIYGDGNDGNCIFWLYKYLGIEGQIECFLAEMDGNESLCGIPIRSISNISEAEKRNAFLIIETDNMVNRCDRIRKMGFFNWCSYSQMFEA